ncbi:hypothetical protein F5Y18DRAFT_105147 [Xylariaceae sp. FL1019]|nr:hypothetical protein F5Y18DRAFT_105147 [Xylariaceae sp. FL1019]
MTPSVVSLPNEVLYSIVSYLRTPDHAALTRSCKSLNDVLTPLLWSEIELHHSGTHEGVDVESQIDDLKYKRHKGKDLEVTKDLKAVPEYPYKQLVYEPSRRKYQQPHLDPLDWEKYFSHRRQLAPGRATDNCNRRNNQFGREEKFVGVQKITSKERWAVLSSYVRSLCLSIAVDDEVAEVLASLNQLRSLELIGLPVNNGHPPKAPEIRMPELRNLKLRGYFPGALVRNICDNAGHISHLDIGLLATPTDDVPYKNNLLANEGTRSKVTEEEALHYLEHGAEALALEIDKGVIHDAKSFANKVCDEEEDGSDDPHSGDDDGSEDSEDSEDEDEAPWALHGPIWLPRSLPHKFTALTHLHLVKPYTGETSSTMSHDHFVSIPHRYEQILNMEWVALLEAVGGTLRELILEHRIPMECGDTVGDGDAIPEYKGSNVRGQAWRDPGPDRGDILFCRSVLRLLIEHSDRFPKLERLSFRGIQIKGLRTQGKTGFLPGENGLPNNDEILQRRYPHCKIDLFEQAYPIHVYAGYVYQRWPQNRHEAMQDQGDGLLYNASYFNDYKKRNGPQWRVTD